MPSSLWASNSRDLGTAKGKSDVPFSGQRAVRIGQKEANHRRSFVRWITREIVVWLMEHFYYGCKLRTEYFLLRGAITEVVDMILCENGYEAYLAFDGKDGLKKFDSVHPDLVITDIVMPDMEGIEFMRKLKKKRQGIPILVMSRNVIGQKFFKTAQILGAKASLTKPLSPQELITAVEQALA